MGTDNSDHYCQHCDHPHGYHNAETGRCSMPVLRGTNTPISHLDPPQAVEQCRCGLPVRPLSLELDEADAAILASALRTSYVYVLDAMANCAGRPYGEYRRRKPHDVTGHRDKLDRIERILSDLGHPMLSTGRRADVERYYAQEQAIWDAEQMLAGGGA